MFSLAYSLIFFTKIQCYAIYNSLRIRIIYIVIKNRKKALHLNIFYLEYILYEYIFTIGWPFVIL